MKSGNLESNSRRSAYKTYLLPLNYSPLSRFSRLAFMFIVPCLTLIRLVNHPRPPSSHSFNYFRRISKASRLLQSLNLSHFLWIKFFVDCIALQDFKPTTSGKCLYRHIIANLPYARATVFNHLLVMEQIYRLGIRTGFNVFTDKNKQLRLCNS